MASWGSGVRVPVGPPTPPSTPTAEGAGPNPVQSGFESPGGDHVSSEEAGVADHLDVRLGTGG